MRRKKETLENERTPKRKKLSLKKLSNPENLYFSIYRSTDKETEYQWNYSHWWCHQEHEYGSHEGLVIGLLSSL